MQQAAVCLVLFVSTEPIHKISTCNCSLDPIISLLRMWRFLDGVPPPKKTKTDETIKEKKPKNITKLLELGSSKTIEKFDAHGSLSNGSRTLRQIIKCFTIYVNGT